MRKQTTRDTGQENIIQGRYGKRYGSKYGENWKEMSGILGGKKDEHMTFLCFNFHTVNYRLIFTCVFMFSHEYNLT